MSAADTNGNGRSVFIATMGACAAGMVAIAAGFYSIQSGLAAQIGNVDGRLTTRLQAHEDRMDRSDAGAQRRYETLEGKIDAETDALDTRLQNEFGPRITTLETRMDRLYMPRNDCAQGVSQ